MCRLCGGKLRNVLRFKNNCIGNDLKKTPISSINQKKYPLGLNNCTSCNHFQLNISIDPRVLYASNYTYLSGIGKTFVNHFSDYCNWITKKLKLNKKDFVVDIGSNDGTCLSFFKKKKINICGVDPAKLPAKIANKKGIYTLNKFYGEKTNKFIIKKFGQPSLITSHNVLAHIDDIKSVFHNLYELLKLDGYLCFEIGYFREVLKNNYLDTIYHEHLDYHHANPLVNFLNSIGFSVIDISTNKIQGGTLRILSKKKINIQNEKRVINFLKKEKKGILYNFQKIQKNVMKFEENLKKVSMKILELKKKNQTIIGYGSPTKAALLASIIKINSNLINYTIEDNQLKLNKYIPGTNIKIKKISKIDINSCNFIFLFAWNFEKDIVNKLKSIKEKNVKIHIIVPLSEMKIYEI